MQVVTDTEMEGAVDEGRATERVVCCIATSEQADWMGRSFLRSRTVRDGWGRTRVRVWFWLRPGQEATTTGRTLEDAIETARQRQRSAAGLAWDGRGRVA